MKLIPLILALALTASAEDYKINLALDEKIVDIGLEELAGNFISSDVEYVRNEIGMPASYSGSEVHKHASDWWGKSKAFNHHFNSWKEFEDFENNGCKFPSNATPDFSHGWLQSVAWTNSGGIFQSNYGRPVKFESDYELPITNLVIATNYTGTIQIGKNIWKISELQGNPFLIPDWITKPFVAGENVTLTNAENVITIQATNQCWLTNELPYWDSIRIGHLNPQLTMTTVRLEETTNWTGTQFNGRELGYVATNHIASVVYQGATNEYTLKTVASEIAKWRTVEPTRPQIFWYNVPWNSTNMFITNYSVIQCGGRFGDDSSGLTNIPYGHN